WNRGLRELPPGGVAVRRALAHAGAGAAGARRNPARNRGSRGARGCGSIRAFAVPPARRDLLDPHEVRRAGPGSGQCARGAATTRLTCPALARGPPALRSSGTSTTTLQAPVAQSTSHRPGRRMLVSVISDINFHFRERNLPL